MYTEAAVTTVASASAGARVLMAMIVPLILLIVFLIIWFKAAKNMARIAADKGYTERRWFHYCFWLGLFGYLMVCAMPDKNSGKR